MVESIKIKNLTTNVVKSFDMSEADYLIYEGAIDWGTVAVNHNTFSYPTQIGAYITNTVIGTRDISISGWIIGETLEEIEGKKNSLSRLINPVEQVTITLVNIQSLVNLVAMLHMVKNMQKTTTYAASF